MTTHELYQLEDGCVIAGKGIGLNDKTIHVTEAVVFRLTLKNNKEVLSSEIAYRTVRKEKMTPLLEFTIPKDKVLFIYPFNVVESD